MNRLVNIVNTFNSLTKEEYWSNFTLDPGKVTCEKCKEILRKQKIMM